MKLSVVINTKNSATTLEKTLRSVKSLADQIVVVDMNSTDKTWDIAKKYGAQTFSFKDVGYVEPARNFALSKATGDWILVIDADEELSEGLAKQIPGLMQSLETDAYFIPRQNIIFDSWAKTGWWPDHILRLFRKGVVTWPEEIHAVPSVSGKITYLETKKGNSIIHHNYQHIDQFIDRAQRYAAVRIQSDYKLRQPFENFFDEMIRRFYFWEGNKQGQYGAHLSLLQAMAEEIVNLHQWEKDGFPSSNKSLSLVKVLQKRVAEAKYWEAFQQEKEASGIMKLYWKFRKRFRL